MTTIFDRFRSELDHLGDKMKEGLETGRLHIEKARVTSNRNDAARELGLLTYQKARGTAADEARAETLMTRLDELQAELARLDRELAAVRAETVSVGEDPPPPSQTAESEVQPSA